MLDLLLSEDTKMQVSRKRAEEMPNSKPDSCTLRKAMAMAFVERGAQTLALYIVC